MKRLVLTFWPFIGIFAVWLFFSSPFFFKGLVPYASTYQVNFFAPWSHYTELHGPVKNNAMPDVHTQIYPWKKLTIDTFKEKQIPLWNSYSFAGNPHLANFQTAVLSPFNILFFVWSFIDAWSLLVLLQPLLAGVFMVLLMRQYKVSNEASFLSSITFMFCGFIVVWMAYGTLSYAITYLPLSLFFIEKFKEVKKKKYLLFFSITIALSVFSGHFQTSLYFLMFIFFYLLWQLVNDKDKKQFLQLQLSLLFGLALSLPQLWLTIQFYLFSVRSESYISGGGIPYYYLITLIAPDFFGNPVTRNDWFGFYAEWSSFVGIIPLFFASFALFVKKNKTVYFYILMVVFILICAIDSFIQPLIGSLKIPVLSTSNPSRIIVLLSFSFAVLSGFGLNYITLNLKKKNIYQPIIVFLLVIACIWVYLFISKPLPQDKMIIAQRNFILPTVLLGIVVTLLAAYHVVNKKLALAVVYIILILSTFDSVRFVQKWMPFDKKSLVYSESPVIEAIEKRIGYGRMFGNFGGEIAVYYKIPSLEGYDPLYINRYGEFIQFASRGEYIKSERSVVKLDRFGLYTDRVLDLTGVSLIFHPKADTNQSWAYPVWKDTSRYTLLYSDNVFELYSNKSALPRASLFYSYIIEPSGIKTLEKFFSKDFDFKNNLLLEEDPRISSTDNKGTAQIIEYSPTKIKIEVNTSSEAMLFLADNYYPGWEAKIYQNNKIEEVKIFRANYTFRSVRVPKGNSVVEFTYNPISLR